jgi:uncharacterized membrane protein YkoI
MTKNSLVTLLVSACLSCTLQLAHADDDVTPADAARMQKSGEIISEEDLLKRVHAEFPGKVVETELERKGGRYIYEVEVVSEKGVKREMQFDAKTGDVLDTAEGEDDEDGDDN